MKPLGNGNLTTVIKTVTRVGKVGELVKFTERKLAEVFLANSDRREVRKSVLETLKARELQMAYQPIVDHTNQTIFAYESLARPNVKGLPVRPDVWFQVAHEHGHALETDLLAIRSAIIQSTVAATDSIRHKQSTAGVSLHHPVRHKLFINVLSSSLMSKSFEVELQSIFREGLLTPDELVIEITEHVSYDPASLSHRLRELRTLGISFALDDLGLGASNIASIVELDPDFIKLDKVLVSGIEKSPSKQKMVEQLVGYMGAGNRVIAEGIECQGDLDVVREVGVQLSQGFYWGQPDLFHALPDAPTLFPSQKSADTLTEVIDISCPNSDTTLQTMVPQNYRNHGSVSVSNHQITVKNPQGTGRFATIDIPIDPRLEVLIGGKRVIGRVFVQETDDIVVETKVIEPKSELIAKETADNMEVVLTRTIVPGKRYHLVNRDSAGHVVLELESEVVLPRPLSPDIVMDLLEGCGYYGTKDHDAIREICSASQTTERVVLRGLPPIPGTADSYEQIQHEEVYDPLHRRMELSTVTAGTQVAIRIPGMPGVPGRSVFGDPVIPPPVAPAPVIGSGVAVIGEMLIATRNGRFLLSPTKIDVIPELVIGGNLSSKDGAIDFDGDVVVYGAILDGAHVQASGTVTVHGSILCATVLAERGLFASGSIVGSQVVAGQSRFLYQKAEPLLRRCVVEYERLREEYLYIVERVTSHGAFGVNIWRVTGLLLEKRHPMLLGLFERIACDHPELTERDTLFGQFVQELRSKWLSISRTSLGSDDVNALSHLLSACLQRVEQIASAEPANIRTLSVTSSVVRATGRIIVRGSGVYTSTFESEQSIVVRGTVRGGFLIAREEVHVKELGTSTGTETSVMVIRDTGKIHVKVRHPNTLLQVGEWRERNFETQYNVLYRGNRENPGKKLVSSRK